MPNPTIGHVILEDSYVPEDTTIVSKTNGNPVAEACLQEAEEENRNGRCYMTEDLVREQNCARTRELLKAGYMLGEAGHPVDNSIVRQQTIDPKETAVRYLKFWMEGPKWMAHYTGTNNAYGEAVNKDLESGCHPAFSMRSLGTLQQINGRNTVRDLKYITHDFVIFPSHPGAYTTKLVTESAGGGIKTFDSYFEAAVYERDKRKARNKSELIPIYNEQVMDYIKQESANLQSVIEQFEIFYDKIEVLNNGASVMLVSKNGDRFYVNIETYIKNDIEHYCSSFFD